MSDDTTVPGASALPALHGETGALAVALAALTAPPDGEEPAPGRPYDEAMVAGLMGGIGFGYHTFAYAGAPPQAALLPRNTFDPVGALLSRLAVPRDVRRTADPAKAERQLEEALAEGRPVVAWLDLFSLSYMALPHDPREWRVQPVVIAGLEGDEALVVDRAPRPWRVPRDQLANARGRVAKDKHQLMLLDPPDPERLPEAVRDAVAGCVAAFLEPPPKGRADGFGFAAMERLRTVWTRSSRKEDWDRFFPPGEPMVAALAGDEIRPGAYAWLTSADLADGADRRLYARFLEAAADLLDAPSLAQAAESSRDAAGRWRELAEAFLPDDAPTLAALRATQDEMRRAFRDPDEKEPVARQVELRERFTEERAVAAEAFPWDEEGAARRRADWAERLAAIEEVEREMVAAMQEATG